MSFHSLIRCAIFACAFASFAPAAQAFDILPDPKLHSMQTRSVTTGTGKSSLYWNVWDVNKEHYKGEGQIVWTFAMKGNPVPGKRKDAEAWFKKQIAAVVKGLGGEQPKQILTSMEMAGSTVSVEGPPFAADFNLIYDKREQVTGNIYALKVMQGGRGRLIVFGLNPGEDRALPEPAAEFARLWSKRLKDMHPNESR